MACQVPSCSLPPLIKMVRESPISEAIMCDGEFPSICLNGKSMGTNCLNPLMISVRTSGSAPSLMVSPAVVCGLKRIQTPSCTPDSVTCLCTSLVISTRCICSVVGTVNFPLYISVLQLPVTVAVAAGSGVDCFSFAIYN